MTQVLIPRYSGILSAYGLSLADVVVEKQEPSSVVLTNTPNLDMEERESIVNKHIRPRLTHLANQVLEELTTEKGFDLAHTELEYFLNMRYEGTDTAMMIHTPPSSSSFVVDLVRTFVDQYQREFGFTLQLRNIVIDDIRIRGTGLASERTTFVKSSNDDNPWAHFTSFISHRRRPLEETTSVYFQSTGRIDIPVYLLADLGEETQVRGPVLIMQDIATVVVEPEWTAFILKSSKDIVLVHHHESTFPLQVSVKPLPLPPSSTKGLTCDPIQLSIFSHRFMGIAEQMGRTLQRTSVSVNIKERLDFSCALFSPDGGLGKMLNT